MSKQKKQSLIATLLIILLIVIDQIIKVVVKLNMNFRRIYPYLRLVPDTIYREQWYGMGYGIRKQTLS